MIIIDLSPDLDLPPDFDLSPDLDLPPDFDLPPDLSGGKSNKMKLALAKTNSIIK
jgi:hypothetical protein